MYQHIKAFYYFILLAIMPIASLAQQSVPCGLLAALPQEDCSGCTELTDGANINSPDVRCFTGTNATFNNLNINGGTLRVCSGTLTLNSIAFNGGDIIVYAGATLNIGFALGDATVLANRGISNYGTININPGSSLTLNGGQSLINNGVFNYLSGDFNVNSGVLQNNEPGEMNLVSLNLNNAKLVNAGSIDCSQNLRVNSGSTVCMRLCCRLSTVNLFNQQANSFYIGPFAQGPCISYTGNAEMNQPLTEYSALVVCRGPSSTVSGGANPPFGDAMVQLNCNGCAAQFVTCTILPVTLLSFDANWSGVHPEINWELDRTEDMIYVAVQRSTNGSTFADAVRIPAAERQTGRKTFLHVDQQVPAGVVNVYYRLQMVSKDGTVQYSPIRQVSKAPTWSVTANPNPFTDRVWLTIESPVQQAASIQLVTADGRVVLEQKQALLRGINTVDIRNLGYLSAGNYWIRVASKGQMQSIRAVKAGK